MGVTGSLPGAGKVSGEKKDAATLAAHFGRATF